MSDAQSDVPRRENGRITRLIAFAAALIGCAGCPLADMPADPESPAERAGNATEPRTEAPPPPDPFAIDPDGDGLSDGREAQLGTHPRLVDTDGDDLSDGQEYLLGTDPLLADADADGLSDAREIELLIRT